MVGGKTVSLCETVFFCVDFALDIFRNLVVKYFN